MPNLVLLSKSAQFFWLAATLNGIKGEQRQAYYKPYYISNSLIGTSYSTVYDDHEGLGFLAQKSYQQTSQTFTLWPHAYGSIA